MTNNTRENSNLNKIRRCFNRASPTYDQYSYPQQIIGSHLISSLSKYLSSIDSVIDIGCGSGIITAQLAAMLKCENFYAVDISDELIAQAKKRLKPYCIQFINADFDSLVLNDGLFQLGFSNMALHWSGDFCNTLLLINRMIADNGILAFTIPMDGTFSELASKNNFFTFEDIKLSLINSGFELLEYFDESLTFGFDSWIKALKSIKATGANYVFNRNTKSLANNTHHFRELSSLTYKTGYFIARKKYHVI